MRNLTYLLAVFAAITLLSAVCVSYIDHSSSHSSPEKKAVTASFFPVYISAYNLLYDADDVRLSSLSEPQTGCLHDYVLTPGDVQVLNDSDVFLVNGGGMESFLDDILSDCPDLTVIDTSEGISGTIEDNSHYWMSVPLYREQVSVMSDALISCLSTDEGTVRRIRSNTDSYLSEIDKLIRSQESVSGRLNGTNVILFHEAYEYVAKDYSLNICGLIDLDEERQVSAKEVSEVIDSIKDNNVTLVLADRKYGKNLGDLVSKETGVTVIYLDTIVTADNDQVDMNTYLERMSDNIKLLQEFTER